VSDSTILLSSPDALTGVAGPRRRRRIPWLVRRLLLSVVTLFLVSLLVFIATQALPGDATQAILRGTATEERVASLREELGLDEPLSTQYWDWLSGAVQGDFGTSLLSRQPVQDVIGNRFTNTGVLIVTTLALSVPLALVLAAACAMRRDRLLDHVTQVVFLFANSVPEFVVGIVLVLAFATSSLALFPAVSEIGPGELAFSHPSSLVLPVAALTIACMPYLTRLFRGSLIEALESDYVEMARLKGLSERRVLFRHALPNALAPAIQGVAVGVAYLAGQVVAVEYLFNYRGLGGALTEAVGGRDLPLIQATVLVLALMIIISNLLADVATMVVSPRARTAAR
jgi:peptide/nickel transport system permease protein